MSCAGVLDFISNKGTCMEPPPRASIVRFGTYEIALPAGDLRKSGLRIKVQQQPLRLLEMLLERPGEVVTREELRSRIWPNESFGDFDQAVNVAIAKLRVALGDSATNPRFIETLPRRGYRFIADVSVAKQAVGASASAHELASPGTQQPELGLPAASPKTQPRQRDWRTLGLAIVLLLLIFAVGIAVWRGRQPAAVSTSIPVRSLAVLPLENLSNSSQDYFADGMTDELITNLAQISALRVISRTSVMQYKGVRKPLGQIANALNVDAVVEGTVLRSGNQVRITAQLIQAPADKHLWAQSYEGDVRDSLALQKKVARAIADQIRITLTPHEQAVLENVKIVNPEAHENYLRGRYFLNKRTADDLKKAAYYFNQSIQEDPKYPLPYTGLADIDQLSERPQLAREEVQKALALDDQLAEAHTSLARLLYRFNGDWQGADREFKRALELDHNYAPAHHWYSMYLGLEGRREQALAEAEKACELDPLSAVVGANLAKTLQEQGQYDKAIERAKKTLDLEPNSAVTHAVLGLAYQDKRMYTEAISEFKKALQLGGPPEEMRGLLGYAFAVSGDSANAGKMIAELKALWPTHTHAALYLAVVFSGLGDKENSLNWLAKAQEVHESDLVGIGRDSHFVEVRSDPRFQALLHRVGAPN
jgi:TolB-like protein/DNA-binding winged helix-turn-helix (wHTH) protein/Flp pilus assembly protein TadD